MTASDPISVHTGNITILPVDRVVDQLMAKPRIDQVIFCCFSDEMARHYQQYLSQV